MGGGIFIVFLILVAIIGPHLVQNPDTYNSNLIDPTFAGPSARGAASASLIRSASSR